MPRDSLLSKTPVRACAAAAALAMMPVAQAATWTQLTNTPTNSVETMLLLTDGTILAHSYDNPGNIWQRLTPAADGSYINGTWSTIAPMGVFEEGARMPAPRTLRSTGAAVNTRGSSSMGSRLQSLRLGS